MIVKDTGLWELIFLPKGGPNDMSLKAGEKKPGMKEHVWVAMRHRVFFASSEELAKGSSLPD